MLIPVPCDFAKSLLGWLLRLDIPDYIHAIRRARIHDVLKSKSPCVHDSQGTGLIGQSPVYATSDMGAGLQVGAN